MTSHVLQNKYLLPVISILVFLAGLYLVFQPDLSSISKTLKVIPEGKTAHEIQLLGGNELASYWNGRIAVVGGDAAYEEFHAAYLTADPNDQHTAAHVFGGELFDVEGVDGFRVCDLQYSYGCYHEFLGQAIFHEGMQVVGELNQGCYDDLSAEGQELSCQHGIGHGILAAVGYETETLPEALDACKDLPYNDPIGGCYGGVFMEYNLRTMLTLDGVPIRDKETDNLLEPCASMPEYSQVACYYWHPQWWLSALVDEGIVSRLERHEKMGELCDAIGKDELRDTCLKGIGNNIITTGITPKEAIDLCQAAASDERGEVLCLADAANSFHAAPALKDQAPDVCEGLSGEYYEYCYAHSINQMNLVNQGNI